MKTSQFGLFKATVLLLFFLGCTQRPMDGTMGGWGHMMGYGWYGGGLMWVILIIVAVVVIYFVLNRSKNHGSPDDSDRESPMDILKKRYAKGDITKEEFDRLKRDINE